MYNPGHESLVLHTNTVVPEYPNIGLENVKNTPYSDGNIDAATHLNALRQDDKYMYVSCWKYEGEDKDPIMLKEDLNYECIKVQQRNYKQ